MILATISRPWPRHRTCLRQRLVQFYSIELFGVSSDETWQRIHGFSIARTTLIEELSLEAEMPLLFTTLVAWLSSSIRPSTESSGLKGRFTAGPTPHGSDFLHTDAYVCEHLMFVPKNLQCAGR